MPTQEVNFASNTPAVAVSDIDSAMSRVDVIEEMELLLLSLRSPGSQGLYEKTLQLSTVPTAVLNSVVGHAIQLMLITDEARHAEVHGAFRDLLTATRQIVPFYERKDGGFYTVVLLYPDPTEAQTYTNTVFAQDAGQAVSQVFQMAVNDNHGNYEEDEFQLLEVFMGCCESAGNLHALGH